MNLGSRLKEAREKKGLTQLDAARKVGISNGTLSGYERNYRDPDTDVLKKLSELYEVSPSWLIAGKDKITNDQAKNVVLDIYTRLPQDKKRIIDDMIRALDQQ